MMKKMLALFIVLSFQFINVQEASTEVTSSGFQKSQKTGFEESFQKTDVRTYALYYDLGSQNLGAPVADELQQIWDSMKQGKLKPLETFKDQSYDLDRLEEDFKLVMEEEVDGELVEKIGAWPLELLGFYQNVTILSSDKIEKDETVVLFGYFDKYAGYKVEIFRIPMSKLSQKDYPHFNMLLDITLGGKTEGVFLRQGDYLLIENILNRFEMEEGLITDFSKTLKLADPKRLMDN